MRLKGSDSELSLVILSPSMVNEIFTLFNFCYSMISSTPDISNIIESNSIKCQAIFSFSSFIDSSSSCKRFRLSATEYFIIDQNTCMVSTWYKFLNGLISITSIQRNGSELHGYIDWFDHFLTSQVIVITCKIYNTIDTIGKHGVIISCRYQVDWIVQLYL